jgi:hypothetical protein
LLDAAFLSPFATEMVQNQALFLDDSPVLEAMPQPRREQDRSAVQNQGQMWELWTKTGVGGLIDIAFQNAEISPQRKRRPGANA